MKDKWICSNIAKSSTYFDGEQMKGQFIIRSVRQISFLTTPKDCNNKIANCCNHSTGLMGGGDCSYNTRDIFYLSWSRPDCALGSFPVWLVEAEFAEGQRTISWN